MIQPAGFTPQDYSYRINGNMPPPANITNKQPSDKISIDGDTVEIRGIGKADESGRSKQIGEPECQTCAERKYVDGSDDSSVSYQVPTNISPQASKAAVLSHEQEHVINERADAEKEGAEVVRQSVSLQYSSCPECGKSYVSGGTTTTVTSKSIETNIKNQESAAKDA